MRCLLALGLLGCANPLPEPPERRPPDAGVRVSLEPDASHDAAPRVVRLVLDTPDAGAVGLYAGTLGSYHLRRIAAGDLPGTLVERAVPTRAWSRVGPDAGAQAVLAPLRALEPGQTYTLASRAGVLAELRIADPPRAPLLGRLWPPPGLGGTHGVYCGEGADALQLRSVELGPSGDATLAPGAFEDLRAGCARLEVAGSLSAPVLPPPALDGVELDPAELVPGDGAAPPALACGEGQQAILGACLQVEDTRIVVTAASALWGFRFGEAEALFARDRSGRFALGGFEASWSGWLHVSRALAGGVVATESVALTTRPPLPRLVIDEVLADPIGPEPDQEWVELVNAGAGDVDLLGHALVDLGGVTALPSHRVRPGRRVLLVGPAYRRDSRWDVAPPEDADVVVLDALGKGGLANGGEPLELADPRGAVVSAFPRAPRPRPGISVARRSPLELDDDDEAFGLHAPPGASPGRPNELE